jgi:SAM-dependent methyltransferase
LIAMALPDLSPLRSLKPHDLLRIRDRLRARGVTFRAAHPVFGSASDVPPMLQAPLRRHHARKVAGPVGAAMRALLFDDPIDADEAKSAFGDDLKMLLDVGLLAETRGGIVSPFVLGVVDDLYVLADVLTAGAEAVMGLGPTTIVLARASKGPRVKSALELGCGAATAALVLSRRADRVVATDLSPRAVELARINVALNGATNVDVREGSLFDPVKDETFDVVVSQPPFVARPSSTSAVTFLHGGARGDELVRTLLADLPKHLSPSGRAILLMEWPDVGGAGESIDRTVGGLVGEGMQVLVLAAPATDVATHAALYAAGLHPTIGSAYEEEVVTRAGHLESLGVRAIVPTLTIVARGPARLAPSHTTLPIQPLSAVALDGATIDRKLAGIALAADPERLLATTLCTPHALVLTQRQVGPGAEVPSTLHASFPADAAMQPVDLTLELLALLTAVHESKTVAAGIALCAEQIGIPAVAAREKLLPPVADALRYGLLQIAD